MGKAWWTSKTIWASVVAIAAAALSAAGVWDMSDAMQAEVVALIMGGVGIALRFVTREPIG